MRLCMNPKISTNTNTFVFWFWILLYKLWPESFGTGNPQDKIKDVLEVLTFEWSLKGVRLKLVGKVTRFHQIFRQTASQRPQKRLETSTPLSQSLQPMFLFIAHQN